MAKKVDLGAQLERLQDELEDAHAAYLGFCNREKITLLPKTKKSLPSRHFWPLESNFWEFSKILPPKCHRLYPQMNIAINCGRVTLHPEVPRLPSINL